MPGPQLSTARLQLRPLRGADERHMVAEITSDPAVMAHLPRTDEGLDRAGRLRVAQRYINAFSEMWEPTGYGGWAIWHRADADNAERFIGFCGFIRPKLEAIGPELGYGIGRSWWGQGIVSEAATAALGWLFDNTAQIDVYAVTMADNAGSRKVLEKLGFVLERHVSGQDHERWAGYGELPFYTLHRDRWYHL